MKVGIMQPYFLPYLGYFQLIEEVDVFVVYDNVEYTKKGWLTRNRMLVDGKEHLFSIPVKKGSDHVLIRERHLADSYDAESAKLLRKIEAAYRMAPHYDTMLPVITQLLTRCGENLFDHIFNSIRICVDQLGIDTRLVVSSTLKIDGELRGAERVIAICKALDGDRYINPIGGYDLYNAGTFREHGINLSFLRPVLQAYDQFNHAFVPGLSILDMMMFCSRDQVRSMLKDHQLVQT